VSHTKMIFLQRIKHIFDRQWQRVLILLSCLKVILRR